MVKRKRGDVNLKNVRPVGKVINLRKSKNLKEFLDYIYQMFNNEGFVETDPIFFPKTLQGNTEFIAFASSVFAYGRVNLIKNFLNSFFTEIGVNPFEIDFEKKHELYYRFQKNQDIMIFCEFMKNVYINYGSIESFFKSKSPSLENSLEKFIEYARQFGLEKKASEGYLFLFPKYGSSGLKRFRMFLRWMVRDKDIDFGLWKGYKKSELVFPVDTHILRFGKNIGILSNTSNTHLNALKITDFFRLYDTEDPLKYDFTLTRLGMLNGCIFKKNFQCEACTLFDDCVFGKM